jgi:hypothetical protein
MSEASGRRRSPLMWAIGVVACAILAYVGILVTLGSLVGIHLEMIGFGTPRDTAPRVGHIAAMSIGAGAGILVPAAACIFLYRSRSQRVVVAVGGVAALVVAVILFGMRL